MNCEKRVINAFEVISIAITPVLGVLIGVLFANGLLPGIIAGVWIAIAVAAISVAAILIGSAAVSRGASGCLPCRVGSLVASAAGTLLAGVAAITIGLTVGSILSAALVGIGAFFFFFLIARAVSLAVCLVCASCRY